MEQNSAQIQQEIVQFIINLFGDYSQSVDGVCSDVIDTNSVFLAAFTHAAVMRG